MTVKHQDLVYLASPIDLSSAAPELMDFVNESLQGVVVYNPARAWSVPDKVPPSPSIQSVNVQALRRASLVVGILTDGPSLGVPSEVAVALETGTPIVLFVSRGLLNRSWYLQWVLEQKNLVGAFVYDIDDEDDEDRLVVTAVTDAFANSPVAHSAWTGEVQAANLRYYFMSTLGLIQRMRYVVG